MADVYSTNSDQKVSTLDEPLNPSANELLIKNKSYQFQALFLKNLSIQKRLWFANCCQIFTPMLCLTIIFILKRVLLYELKNNQSYEIINIPILSNNPVYDDFYYDQRQDYLTWYMFQFQEGISTDDIEFIGNNTGYRTSIKSGLWGNFSRFQQYCKRSLVDVPNFRRSNLSNPNQDIINRFEAYVDFSADTGSLAPGIDKIPDGVFFFNNASEDYINVVIEVDDLSTKSLHRENGISRIKFGLPEWVPFDPSARKNRLLNTDPGWTLPSKLIVSEGFLTMIDTISKSYMNSFTKNMIEFMISYMPMKINFANNLASTINILSGILYPFALGLGVPLYMYGIIQEKEEKIIQMMKMNGMQMKYYWANSFVYNFLIYFLTATLFWIYGYLLLSLQFFELTNFLPLFLLLMGWGIAQVGLAFFFSAFISKTRTATILGYLLSMFIILVATSYNTAIYSYPSTLPLYYLFIPHFSFSRLIYIFCVMTTQDIPVTLHTYITQQECLISILLLYIMGVIFMILGIYFNEIIKSDFGVKKHPLFCLQNCRKKKKIESLPNHMLLKNDKLFQERLLEVQGEDEDCAAERELINNLDLNHSNYSLVIQNIRKVYKEEGTKEERVAVRFFNLGIKEGETFGLLGPNGAGKTTLISMLTGLYSPEEGNAWVSGHDIRTQIEKVHLHIGVCPQFDLLWPDLTVEEHLLFYGRLKGCKGKNLTTLVEKTCKEVKLFEHKHKLAKQLSGGMKRRLSVAISFVGRPKVVFLDEPTTGLDPDNKRQLWDILTQSRGKRSLLITTHSMEEADVLCSRIGIIAFGVMRCLGTQTRLKKKYGDGYRVYINLMKFKDLNLYNEAVESNKRIKSSVNNDEEIQAEVLGLIERRVTGAVLLKNINASLMYKIVDDKVSIRNLFQFFEEMKNNYLITDWTIAQSSLDDVFMNIVEKAEIHDTNKNFKIIKVED